MKYFFAEWTRRAFEDIQHKQFKATVSVAKAEFFFCFCTGEIRKNSIYLKC